MAMFVVGDAEIQGMKIFLEEFQIKTKDPEEAGLIVESVKLIKSWVECPPKQIEYDPTVLDVVGYALFNIEMVMDSRGMLD